jgi:L-gulono-1,4-lactone dehydrogenase
VLADFDELADGNDHFEFFVFPGGRHGVDGPAQPNGPGSRSLATVIAEFVAEDLVQNRLGNRLLQLTGAVPRLYPDGVEAGDPLPVGRRVHRPQSPCLFASHRDIRFTEMEYAVPRAAGPAMVEHVLAWLRRHPVFRSPCPSRSRVVGGDDALLSPSHQRDSAYVAVHQYRGLPWQPYFHAVEAIAAEFGGRPALGQATPHRRRHAASSVTPGSMTSWPCATGSTPDRVFANAYTRQVLGD